MKPRRYLWWFDAGYWFIVTAMVVNIAGCVFCLLYPDSALNRNSLGDPSPPSPMVVGIVTSVASICISIWGLRLNARRRKILEDYRRSLQ